MSTRRNMARRIVSELHRGDLTASSSTVLDAIQTAREQWETTRFAFNERTNDSIVTTKDEPFLSSVPSDIIYIDSLKITISTRDYPLAKRDYAYIDWIDSGQWAGYPEIFCWYKGQIRMYPIPNASYTATFSYLARLPETSSSSSDAWTNEAEKIIRSQAKAEIYTHFLMNDQRAAAMAQEAYRAYLRLNKETQERIGSGQIRPIWF